MAAGGKARPTGRRLPSRRNETPSERADRNMAELLQELRVALPGVQILFAFLLTVPFAARFDTLDDFQRVLYFGVLLSTAIATALFIAPTAHHRLLFRKRDKENLVRVSNRLTIAGLAVLSVSLTGAVLLISDVMFNAPAPVIFTAAIGLTFVGLWGALPLYRRAELSETER